MNRVKPGRNDLTRNWRAVFCARTQVNLEEPDEPGRTARKLRVFSFAVLCFASLESKLELTISSTSFSQYTVLLVYQTQFLWSGSYLESLEKERKVGFVNPKTILPVHCPELKTQTGGIRLGCLKTTRLSSL